MLALGVMPMLRRQAAGLRHLVLTTAIAAAVLTPLAGLALPSWSLPPQLTAPLFDGDRTTAPNASAVAQPGSAAAPAAFVERAIPSAASPWRLAGLVLGRGRCRQPVRFDLRAGANRMARASRDADQRSRMDLDRHPRLTAPGTASAGAAARDATRDAARHGWAGAPVAAGAIGGAHVARRKDRGGPRS